MDNAPMVMDVNFCTLQFLKFPSMDKRSIHIHAVFLLLVTACREINRFQHGPPKAVHSISEVGTAVYNMSEVDSSVPKDESMAVEVYKGRFDRSIMSFRIPSS